MTIYTKETLTQVFAQFTGEKPGDGPREKKRKRIINAAIKLFTEHGYRRTSMDEVARAATVAKGTVYLYYKNKSTLLMAALAAEKMRILDSFAEILSPDISADDRLRGSLGLMMKMPKMSPLISSLLSGDREILIALDDLEPEAREQIADMRLDYLSSMVGAVTGSDGLSEVEVEEKSKVILGLIYCAGVLADERVRGGVELERFGDVLADIVLDGLRPRKIDK